MYCLVFKFYQVIIISIFYIDSISSLAQSLTLVFCFLYSASCILLLVTHIHAAITLICVFCSVSFVVTMLSVTMRLHHLSLNVAHTYILLLVFFCLSLIFTL